MVYLVLYIYWFNVIVMTGTVFCLVPINHACPVWKTPISIIFIYSYNALVLVLISGQVDLILLGPYHEMGQSLFQLHFIGDLR